MSSDWTSMPMRYGLFTPQSSQEMPDSTEHPRDNDSKPYDVMWPDTDESEDEDFLPQNQHIRFPSPTRSPFCDTEDTVDRKRGRMNSVGLAYDTRELLRRRIEVDCCITETPGERARRVIDKAVDNGCETADFSHLNLTEIPDEIAELRYITVFRKDTMIVKPASLEVFLYTNALTCLSPSLFKLTNLTVLSLRNNQLTNIPPDIALLVNLEELSIGNNHLSFIPAELLSIPKLSNLSLCPNPYFSPKSDEESSRRRRVVEHRVPSLLEITTRQWLSKDCHESTPWIPCAIESRLLSLSPTNRCYTCHSTFDLPSIIDIFWYTVFGVSTIPVQHRFCSLKCSKSFNPPQ
ncbi:hypothetical protein J3Q64DRAFT_1407631 [Phycomyces blakesleeanus]|uniref:Uncharacterized protein n=2 Tax=Phycomyces blakesleeanus TaxID=4837 RepID=A0A167NLH6_PHYB8|nr:hypothetical protein PHYBLDRAFT_59734 [Phycomyces blakesleeanus NRRL 1555(-)]OAD76200.1 hypothetical protein PHYBLDRAFT_59734 [Phycomyces blakesleeanus NRRL 1555(-)]|eukprot:XP_018294240.1 hypothetical protein PHYBLDRAFT_59734 [Phycomyces blakesleeanus NRRL 1555(-)]